MKKLSITFFLLLSLLAAVCSPASADVITAMAIEVNPEHLEKTASYARILGYNPDSNTLTVELIAPEVFRGDEVEALEVGDSIFTRGEEVAIQTIKKEWDYVVINEGDYDFAEGAVHLFKEFDDNYRPMIHDDFIWRSVGIIDCPITDSLLFLDYTGKEFGEPLELPFVHTAQELTEQLLEEKASEAYTIGLSCNNVYVVFDAEGNLATIHRFYVPWQ